MAKKKKNILKKIKIEVPGSQANPAPPIGPVLGQAGVNIMEFCTAFNQATKDQQGVVIPVLLTVYEDRSFDFQLKTPPAAVLIKKALKIEKGAGNVKKDKIGQISQEEIRKIAKLKMPDLNAFEIEKAIKVIAGTARSMGVEVVNK